MAKNLREIRKERDKDRREVVKKILSNYGKSLSLIEVLEDEIIQKRERIDGVRSGLGNTDPIKGGGCSQEDTIIKVLDEVKDLEEEIASIKAEIRPIRKAIRSIKDSKNKAIIMRVWVNNSDSMRSLATQYGVSHTAIWKKSDVALLSLYKALVWINKG